MSIRDLTNAGAIPALEAAVRFSAQRQALIAHNIANFSTPDFIPLDVSVKDFQQNLREAVEARRRGEGVGGGASMGPLPLASTEEVTVERNCEGEPTALRLLPRTPGPGILFRDRNNRDMERTLQDLVENATMFRVASDLLRNRYDMLRVAISERV